MDPQYIDNLITIFKNRNLVKELENIFKVACIKNDVLVVATLVTFGMADDVVYGGFYDACKKGNILVIEWLLEYFQTHEISCDVVDRGFYSACKKEHKQVIERLLEYFLQYDEITNSIYKSARESEIALRWIINNT